MLLAIAIMMIAPKLRNIAISSRFVILSPTKKKASKLAKNGPRFPTVIWTVIGIKVAPKVRDVSPMQPVTLRMNKGVRNSFYTLRLLPPMSATAVEETNEIKLAKITMSNELTRF